MKKLLLIFGFCFLFSCDLLESQNQKDAKTCKTCIKVVHYTYGVGTNYTDQFEACGDELAKIPKDPKYNGNWGDGKGGNYTIRTTCK